MKLLISLLNRTQQKIALLSQKLSGEGNRAALIRGATASFSVKVIGAGITLGSQVVAARLLGVRSYGNYIYVLTWINILVLLGKLGFDMTSLRFVAAYHAQQKWSLLKGFLHYSNRVVLFASFSAAVCLAFGVWLFREFLSPEILYTFWVASFILPAFSALQVQQQKLRALQRVVLSQVPQEIVLPLILILGLTVVRLGTETKIQAMAAMTIHLLAILIACSVVSIWVQQNIPQQIQNVLPSFHNKEWLRIALAMIFITGFNLVLSQTDIIMIGALSGTAVAGVYAVASKLSSLLVFVLVAVNSVLAPIIANLYAQGSRQELQRIVSLGVQGAFFSSIALATILLIWGQPLLALFGEEFTVGYSLLVILMIGQLFNAFAGPVGLLLNMTGHQHDAARVLGISAVTNIFLNAILIPSYGSTGAAIATVVTFTFWNTVMAIIVWSKLQIIGVAFPYKLIR